jgi:hypothetical protein
MEKEAVQNVILVCAVNIRNDACRKSDYSHPLNRMEKNAHKTCSLLNTRDYSKPWLFRPLIPGRNTLRV